MMTAYVRTDQVERLSRIAREFRALERGVVTSAEASTVVAEWTYIDVHKMVLISGNMLSSRRKKGLHNRRSLLAGRAYH